MAVFLFFLIKKNNISLLFWKCFSNVHSYSYLTEQAAEGDGAAPAAEGEGDAAPAAEGDGETQEQAEEPAEGGEEQAPVSPVAEETEEAE